MYDAASLLSFGEDQDQPFIFAAVNYRVGGLALCPGLRFLLRTRMGLKWVADNIAAVDSDPDKVTIWGESTWCDFRA
ncbi:unnamed protein product [Clonostachys rosea]|uniref:Carboxylesterase type B domain-containing protein n=1 Tax=Bionectria ochroleuca TaxID=29856 RepID=A0ABY6V2L2_BIOOC|nr:unnamed protein product [Clonostachys rosea]